MKNILAAFIFFTRLPLWRIPAFRLSAEYYKQVINYWAVTGLLTGTLMSGILWLSNLVLPYPVVVIMALVSRVLLTGALHEDGLADFMDGFGGGTDKERILAIMKDSHIGTYGVLGLVFYFLLSFSLLSNFTPTTACIVIIIADPLCKLISSQITRFLPYARTSETSKSKQVYDKISPKSFIISCICGLLPLGLIPDLKWLAAIMFPTIVFIIMIQFLKKKIGGYTGDCCGATFLLCELSFYIGIAILLNVFGI